MRRIFIAFLIFSFLFLGHAYAENDSVLFYQAPSMPFASSGLPLNPVKPVFDIAQAKQDITAVIKELQSIPIGGEETYKRGDTVNISMEKIIDSLINLGIIEFNVEDATVNCINHETGKEDTYIGGYFGFMLKECVLNYLPEENEVKIVHVEFKPNPAFSPINDLDEYKLYIGNRVIEFALCRNYFTTDKGLEWSVFDFILKEYAKDANGEFIGTKETEVFFDFYVDDQNPKPSAYYTLNAIDINSNLLAFELYKWEIGNSIPVGHRPWGPPDNK